MNKKFFNVLLFTAGAAIGSLVTWKVVKTKYERIIQDEIDSFKESYTRCMRGTSEKDEIITEDTEDQDDEYDDEYEYSEAEIVDYHKLATRYNRSGDVTETGEEGVGDEEVPYINGPIVIMPEDFADGAIVTDFATIDFKSFSIYNLQLTGITTDAHKAKSIYCSGNFACPSGEFGELRVYLISKLLLDPMMSEETYYAYMDEFLAAYYGDGWEYIRKYIDKTTELAADGQQTAIGNPFDAITQEEYLANEETFDEWWNKAEELAGDRIEFVKRARYQWRYIKLCLHPNAEDAQALIADVSKADAKVAWREKQWNVDSASDLSLAPTEWKYKS